MEVQQIPVDLIESSPFNPRQDFDEAALDELAASLKTRGLLQPVKVRPVREPVGDETLPKQSVKVVAYQLVYGTRRWMAAIRAGLKTIPTVVAEVSDEDAAAEGMAENSFRVDLTEIEKARWAEQLYNVRYTQEQIARLANVSQPRVAGWLRMAGMDPAVQRMVAPPQHGDRAAGARAVASEGKITSSQALSLSRIPGQTQQRQAAKKVIGERLDQDETQALAAALRDHPQAAKAILSADLSPGSRPKGITVKDQLDHIVNPPAAPKPVKKSELVYLAETGKLASAVASRLDEDRLRELVSSAEPDQLGMLVESLETLESNLGGILIAVRLRMGSGGAAHLRAM